MRSQIQRLQAVDLIKAIGAQLIVLHHLSAYGPIAEAAEDHAPGVVSWLYDYGRWAVQAFLVVGGYLAARSLSPDGNPYRGNHLAAAFERYLRLAVPFAVALSLAVVCAAVARTMANEAYLPAAPRLTQFSAHIALIPGLLGHEALSAGAWYVLIDFQLFLTMLALSTLAAFWRRAPRSLPLLALILTIASLYGFNRDSDYDDWAVYFFGAYGLGAATWWGARSRQTVNAHLILAVMATGALMLDFRGRLVVAFVTAALLALADATPRFARCLTTPSIAGLAAISYSLFLVHFPVLMLANAVFAEFAPQSDAAGWVALVAAWGASLVAAACFHRWVETPAGRLRRFSPRAWMRSQTAPL